MEEQTLQYPIQLNNVNSNTLTLFFVRVDICSLIIILVILNGCGIAECSSADSILPLFLMFILSIIYIFYSLNSSRKVTFIKDETENTLTAKVYNYYRCRKKKIIFGYLNNIQFDVRTIVNKDKTHYRLFIFNTLSKLPSLDIIRNKPLDLYYYFDKIENIMPESDIFNQLNQFTNSPTEFDSPLFFNARKYISRDEINNPNQIYSEPNQNILSKIMRFSNYFYTYHIRDVNYDLENKRCSKTCGIICLNIFLLIAMSVITMFVIKIENLLTSLAINLGTIIVLDLIIFVLLTCFNNRIKRIDCAYSSDFDRMFIGTTTFNEKSYKNIFEFQLNEINRFFIKEIGNKTFLSVTSNNNDIDICEIVDRRDLNNFVSILNEKIERKETNNNGEKFNY